jgi:hypothetical protein
VYAICEEAIIGMISYKPCLFRYLFSEYCVCLVPTLSGTWPGCKTMAICHCIKEEMRYDSVMCGLFPRGSPVVEHGVLTMDLLNQDVIV